MRLNPLMFYEAAEWWMTGLNERWCVCEEEEAVLTCDYERARGYQRYMMALAYNDAAFRVEEAT